MGVLDRIVAHKREELAGRTRQTPLAEMRRRAADAPPARPFHQVLISSWPASPPLGGPPALRGPDGGAAGVRLIAEVKGSSPSAGTIRAEFDPVAIARTYAAAGAAAVSVLTDARFFAGADDHLTRVRAAVDVPVLRKDFTVDPYQVYEARAIGADAVLLIVAVLDRGVLADLASLAADLGMAALIEAHTEAEVAAALAVRAALLGLNNRNLDTLETSLEVTRRLRPLVPAGVTVVAESGIEERQDVEEMDRLGVHAVLVGTALMRSPDPGARVRELLGVPAHPARSERRGA
ncbi:MAG TPA: indole-3-glycerol phosphate synthase TrpC [bacterium]|nr:indole-3-glycerol phosphate synthase TrpC [bacterium]